MHTAVFTIISPNYRHFARVLMGSARQHHPEWERFALVVGEKQGTPADVAGEPFTTISLDSLALPDRGRFYFRYTILELNTAVKPWMFEHLFALGYDRVVFLDPDIVVYSPLIELDGLDPETFLVLTPHLTGSIGGDDHPSERSILLAGAYNLGFLAVSRQPALRRFLTWWKEKLEFQCVVDTARGLFADQKWMDLAPGLFPGVVILRHDGYNVAYWNLGQRTIIGHGRNATVNGRPIRFYHFSGLNPGVPTMVSRHDHGLETTDVGDAQSLINDYILALRAAGYESFRNAPYALGVFRDGTSVPDAARLAYRNSEDLQAAAGADPFARPELFGGIRDRRRGALTARLGVASYQLFSSARPLVRLLPRSVRKVMRESLLGRPDDAPAAAHREVTLPPGLNIVGYIGHETGVGESARLSQKACEATGLPNHLIDVDGANSPARQAVYSVSLYHVNADQTPIVRKQLGSVFEASAYNIGCWHWELPELPDAWIGSAAPLDEIWAPSAFVQSAVSRKVTIPVVHMPHGIEVSEIEPCPPQELGVPPGRFTFLCMFDLASVTARKNPRAAIEAFQRAFPRSPAVALLVKVSHAAEHPEQLAELEELVGGAPNVYLTSRMLRRAHVNGLLDACDAVVSLHRAEGFGLILAEAMYLGKPVVATGWSGNMDFMNGGNSCPVNFDLLTLDRAHGVYPAGQQWADPDIDHAAELMGHVAGDAAYRNRIGDRARQTMRSQFSPAAAGVRYRRRMEYLGFLDRAGNRRR